LIDKQSGICYTPVITYKECAKERLDDHTATYKKQGANAVPMGIDIL
jgi:hypothetical protein